MVGEGGMSPEYFLHHLTLSEATDYVQGQDRRHRQSWEQTRVLANIISKCFTGASLDDWKFPWEKDSPTSTLDEIDDEEQKKFEELKQKCLLINQRNNGRRSSMGIK